MDLRYIETFDHSLHVDRSEPSLHHLALTIEIACGYTCRMFRFPQRLKTTFSSTQPTCIPTFSVVSKRIRTRVEKIMYKNLLVALPLPRDCPMESIPEHITFQTS
ncbi:hypothetical protein H2248_012134 [Termitomyces sp. 'cryptogamus']|nr:hypothetical protein H2248_012134 [Termitomyces sp. 'cryptogamus']